MKLNKKLNQEIMKLQRLSFNLLSLLFIAGVVLLSSCEGNENPTPQGESILPENFSVDIPNAISDETLVSNARYGNARTATDTLQGNDIYEHVGSFIHVGEAAAEIVEEIITHIRIYNIDRPMVLSFEGDDDGRTKNLVVEADADFDGVVWDFVLTITDADSEGNDDGGKALQIFWNHTTNPIEGIAILKPYNIDRDGDQWAGDATFRIDYSEAGEHGYEAHMIVSIAELPTPDPLDDPWAMDGLKLFAGRDGDIVDVYGNSNHPNAYFFSGDAGFNWAFVASGNDETDIGVAEVGLPPSNLDDPTRSVILEYYSIKDVFTREISDLWPGLDQSIIDAYLHNTEAPGYFGTDGFIAGGTSPGEDWDVLADRLQDLSPYNPKEISNLSIDFK